MNKFDRFSKEFRSDIRKEKYDVLSEGGIALKHGSLRIQGFYEHGVNGQDWIREENLIPDAGILHVLNVIWGTATKISAWYAAPFSGTAAVASSWTGANFTANSTEITSGTEGYSEGTRQLFVPGTATAGTIDNYSAKAAFTIVTASSVNINGAGLLSVSTKGGTTGTLSSAIKFGATRTVQNADVWSLGYQLQLTDS